MNKKTTRRLIGVLVVIALAIIVLPLFLKDGDTLNVAKVTPPSPVPANKTNTVVATADDTTPPPKIIDDSFDNEAAKAKLDVTMNKSIQTVNTLTPVFVPDPNQVAANQKSEATEIPKQSKTSVVIAKPILASAEGSVKVIAAIKPEIQSRAHVTTPILRNPPEMKVENKVEVATVKPAVHSQPTPRTMVRERVARHNAWAIQVGYFRVTSNATHIAKALQNKGYNVVTVQSRGGHTKVFVLPERNEVVADNLVNKIAQDVQIRGVVVPYRG